MICTRSGPRSTTASVAKPRTRSLSTRGSRAARVLPRRFKDDEGMSVGPAYLVDTGAVIGVVQEYTKDSNGRFSTSRYVIEMLRSNRVLFEEYPADETD